MAKLERILDYTLKGKKYIVVDGEQAILDANPTFLKDDWFNSPFSKLRSNIRRHYGIRQNRKCAYCRITISPDGSGNAVEHIMPRLRKPQWTFVQHNLSISCIHCNSSKGSKNTMVQHENNYGHSPNHCPTDTNEFKIFNPHFDKWSDHFEIQDEFFLVPIPNTKGPATYKFCNLHRYLIILDYIDELKIREKSYKSIPKRLRKEKRPHVKEQLELAKKSILELIENN